IVEKLQFRYIKALILAFFINPAFSTIFSFARIAGGANLAYSEPPQAVHISSSAACLLFSISSRLHALHRLNPVRWLIPEQLPRTARPGQRRNTALDKHVHQQWEVRA